MKFFFDENIPSKAGEFLSQLGNEVFDIRGTGQEGLHDIEIFGLAQNKQAVFYNNRSRFLPYYSVFVPYP